MARITCGIDWAENHHDVALVDQDGKRVARLRIGDDAAGHTRLLELLAEHGDSAQEPIPVAIETPRGLLVAVLRATGRPIYPINPWRCTATGTGTRWPARSRTPATPSCSRTSCAPIY